jgi:diguanylate cyclase (GGDEF)-like protein
LFYFDCAPALDGYLFDVEAALAFAHRVGNDQVADSIGMYGRLARVLGGDPGARLDERTSLQALRGNRYAAAHSHLTRAMAAALLGGDLLRHTTQVMSMLDAMLPTYPAAMAYTLHALAIADQLREAAPDRSDQFQTGLDTAADWLAERTQDSPENLVHLLRLVEAERAWARADVTTAMRAFDDAQREAAARERPWHRALILERSARFYLANGAQRAGLFLLKEARQEYLAWGAMAKVDQLDSAYRGLAVPPPEPRARETEPAPAAVQSTVEPAALDMLGVLAASQALSSETTIEGLRSRVVETLSTMTGATNVHLLLWDQDSHTWLLSTPDGGVNAAVPVGQAGSQRRAPLSAIRYAERTHEPLVVADATQDDRFAHDPYLAGLDKCSLLAVPIFSRGNLQALLVLENRLIAGAFAADRLDGVLLIARQLAVSLDNSMVYASLERKVAERTDELQRAKDRLEVLSSTDALTGVANRRQLEKVLDREWQRAQHRTTPISLAIVDVDHFKLYNDQYGHPAGDECLRSIAAQLRSSSVETDLVARYGGEEFAIVMPDTNIETATMRAEQLRAAVAVQAQPNPSAPEHVVTVSIGVATAVSARDTTVDHLVDGADHELYRAKRAGRNRVNANVLR